MPPPPDAAASPWWVTFPKAVRRRRPASARGALLHDLILPPYHQIDCGDGAAAAEAAVGRLLRAPLGFPETFYCTSDAVALGVLKAVRGLGWQVPQDVWVIGHGDHHYAPACDLTSVSPSLPEIASAAVEQLLARMRDPDAAPVLRRVACGLAVRGSTGGMVPPPRGEGAEDLGAAR